MGLRLALMIEGQEGLTWDRWRRLARTAEEGGFESLFRSDHLTGLFGDSRRPSLDLWASLTWLATATSRIRFVASMPARCIVRYGWVAASMSAISVVMPAATAASE